jgi:hypothetical protein
MKKLIWTALVATATAASAAVAARLLDRGWRQLFKEPPPEMPGWARFLVGKPLRKQIHHRVPHAHM